AVESQQDRQARPAVGDPGLHDPLCPEIKAEVVEEIHLSGPSHENRTGGDGLLRPPPDLRIDPRDLLELSRKPMSPRNSSRPTLIETHHWALRSFCFSRWERGVRGWLRDQRSRRSISGYREGRTRNQPKVRGFIVIPG